MPKANQLVPGKKVTKLIISHYHFDHTGGFRAAVAAGLTIYSNRGNEGVLREMAKRPTPHYNDVIGPETNRNFEFVPVDEHLRLSDSKTTVDLYRVISNNHMADALFAHMPEQKVFMDSDIATAAFDWQLWPDSYMDNINRYGIEVEKVTTVHEKVKTHQEILEYIEGGLQRVLKRESELRSNNEYHPGYPIFKTGTTANS
ncbi:MBL fold metallo-hydrolase [Paenibacillus sp. FSL R7-0128]|uniref:MBL fold metallo-hydrolase n=1 Tax=Paenibacillus sp. FSL R7-0128 TaxID=2954529 RepID=UPI0030F4BBD6